jgi:hypothetical protein
LRESRRSGEGHEKPTATGNRFATLVLFYSKGIAKDKISWGLQGTGLGSLERSRRVGRFGQYLLVRWANSWWRGSGSGGENNVPSYLDSRWWGWLGCSDEMSHVTRQVVGEERLIYLRTYVPR